MLQGTIGKFCTSNRICRFELFACKFNFKDSQRNVSVPTTAAPARETAIYAADTIYCRTAASLSGAQSAVMGCDQIADMLHLRSVYVTTGRGAMARRSSSRSPYKYKVIMSAVKKFCGTMLGEAGRPRGRGKGSTFKCNTRRPSPHLGE